MGVWEELVGWSTCAACFDAEDGLEERGGIAEEALQLLPYTLPPATMRYGAFFTHLLQYERAAEIRQSCIEVDKNIQKAMHSGVHPAIFSGTWGSTPQHRPDLDLSFKLELGRQRPKSLGFMRRGDHVLLFPWPSEKGAKGALAELRSDFDLSSAEAKASIEPGGPIIVCADPPALPQLKLKLAAVTLPGDTEKSIFAAKDFAVEPLRGSKV